MGREKLQVPYVTPTPLPELIPNEDLEDAKVRARATAEMLAAQHGLPREGVKAKLLGFTESGNPQFSLEESPSPTYRSSSREIKKEGEIWVLRCKAALDGTPPPDTLKISK